MRFPVSLPARAALLAGASTLLALPAGAVAQERLQVIASFSILADMVENIGGEHVEVRSLVGADGDTHVYSPSPRDAQAVAEADLVVFNGLRFEGWMERLIESSDHEGPRVVASDGVDVLSRDDDGKFLPFYVERDIYPGDPFVALDQSGVGQLVEMGCVKGRQTRPNIKLGICGEHGGEPSSVIFCHKIGLDYVSCTPFRVPIARLAAAHAALLEEK